MVIKDSLGERIFDVFNHIFLLLLVFVTLYPCWYVLVASVSDPVQIYASNGVLFLPKGFAIGTYAEVLKTTLKQ